MVLAIELIGREQVNSAYKIHQTISIICKGISVIINDENIDKSKKELDLKLEEAFKHGLKVANGMSFCF